MFHTLLFTDEQVDWNKREQPVPPLKAKKKKTESDTVKEAERSRSSRREAEVDEKRERREKDLQVRSLEMFQELLSRNWVSFINCLMIARCCLLFYQITTCQ